MNLEGPLSFGGVNIGAKRKILGGITNHEHRESNFSPLFTKLSSTTVEKALQITPFYAKQSQCQVGQNQRNLLYDKHICKNGQLVIQTKQSQNKPNSKPIKPKTKPIQTQSKPIQTQFQTSDICLQFSDESQILIKFIDSCDTKTLLKTIGNEVDIYTLLCHYIKILSTEFGLLTLEVVRWLKLKVQHNEKHRNQLELERRIYEQR
ncbi:MAG: hypothetical protein FVQ84_15435 [Planctomycetes bacterium]|nr:hypothetical protein [Planctomycetota bacterium]